jgi:peptidyl-prolyl cis-trans isomerase C
MKGWIFPTVITILLAAVLGLQVAALVRSPDTGASATGANTEEVREAASALRSEGLYTDAVEEYERLLRQPDLSPDQKANILLIIGEMRQEELKDYEGALAAYTKIRTLYPDSKVVEKAEKQMVACLELLDRGRDAQRQLARVADLKPGNDDIKPSDVIVARIGEDRKITLRHLEEEIDRLPEYQRKQFEKPEQKLDFLRAMVGKELMSNLALRKGYDRDPEIREALEKARQDLLASKVYDEEVRDSVKLPDSDLEMYYQANRERYVEPEKVRVADILLDDEAEAREIIDSVTPGTDFAALAREKSKDETTAAAGGVLEPFPRGEYVPGVGRSKAFVDAAFSAEVGTATGPVKTERGFHILKVLEKIPERTRPFDEVRGNVEMALRRQREQEAFDALINRMLEAQDAVIYEDAILNGESDG